MDVLIQSAKTFERLLKYEYSLIAGSKQRLVEISLIFLPEHFAHLIGLHKLKDLEIQRYSYQKLFKLIIEEKLTLSDIQKSVFYQEIKEQLILFPLLEEKIRNISPNSKHLKY